eukprot:366432-Chlamydomonas_euryale.AAC.1
MPNSAAGACPTLAGSCAGVGSAPHIHPLSTHPIHTVCSHHMPQLAGGHVLAVRLVRGGRRGANGAPAQPVLRGPSPELPQQLCCV